MVDQNLQQLSTNTFTVAKWVVSSTASNGTHTTIAGAIAAASSGDIIFICQGTYTENITLPAGITLTALAGSNATQDVSIVGKVTMTAAGTSSISNIQLQTNSDYCLVVSGSNACTLFLNNVTLNCSNNTGINFSNSNSASSITAQNCTSKLGTTGIAHYTMSSPGGITYQWSQLGNNGGSTTASSNSAGLVQIFWCSCRSPISCSSTGTFSILNSYFDTQATNTTALTSAGSGQSATRFSFYATGTASSISAGAGTLIEATYNHIVSTNTVSITGAGTVKSGNNSFLNAYTINTTTQDPLVNQRAAVPTVLPAGDYTVLNFDEVVFVDTTAPRTITLPAVPVQGERHIIKDKSGSAATNNITVAGNGNNIDGSASQVMKANYQSITVIYNGTQWNII